MSSMRKLILATSYYDLTRIPSTMAAKLISMQLGIQLEVVDEEWLLRKGFKPYLPSFALELSGGETLLLRIGGLLNYLELARRLIEEIRKLNLSKELKEF